MVVETKFNPGDNVWAVIDDEPRECSVLYVSLFIGKSYEVTGVQERYRLLWSHSEIYADGVFATKEELLDKHPQLR